MDIRNKPGLGELLRYVGELVEGGADQHYRTVGMDYRARYTPVLRALAAGARTVTEITERTHITQGAVSQTVALLEKDGYIARHGVSDGRKNAIRLTPAGDALVARLERHWQATFTAIAALESEIGYPLREALEAAAGALQRENFASRVAGAAIENRGDQRNEA